MLILEYHTAKNNHTKRQCACVSVDRRARRK